MNMKTTDKVYVGDPTVGTSTTTASQWQTYTQPKAERGWECPRCGRINAPWVRQCDCSRNYDKWDITWNKDDCTKPWWYDYKVTCNGTSAQAQIDSDTFKVHPESTIYKVGGSDYKAGDTYVNVSGTQSNSNVNTWNCTNPDNCHTPHYTTETVVTDGIHNFYNLRTPKESK